MALLGNVANCLLPIAQALRDEGIEADLFIDSSAPAIARPENSDAGLADAPWIRRGRWFSPWALLAPRWARVVRLLRTYDLIVVSGPGPTFAQWAGRPWCWLVSGADLTVTPFPWTFRSAFPTRVRRVAAYPLAHWQRRAAGRAHEIWVQPFEPMRDAIARLGLGSPPVSDRYMPLMVEVDHLRQGTGEPVPADLVPIINQMDAADLVLFHPSRIIMDATDANRRSGQWKGNGKLLHALADLRSRGDGDGILLVLLCVAGSRDLAPAKGLARELGVEDQILWARPPGRDAFTRDQMRHLYAHSDVVADEFAAGWFGLVTLEALAMGLPVVSHVDEAAMAVLYPGGHPIRSALEPHDIAGRIAELRDPQLRATVGASGQAWIEVHHSAHAVKARYLAAVRDVVDRRPLRS